MKTVSDMTKLLVLFFAGCASSWQASAGPIIAGREWYQPAGLLGYSWKNSMRYAAVAPVTACWLEPAPT